MSPLLARYVEIDPSTRTLALAIIAGVLALALGAFLWLAFRKNR
jgi:hypothetical protein